MAKGDTIMKFNAKHDDPLFVSHSITIWQISPRAHVCVCTLKMLESLLFCRLTNNEKIHKRNQITNGKLNFLSGLIITLYAVKCNANWLREGVRPKVLQLIACIHSHIRRCYRTHESRRQISHFALRKSRYLFLFSIRTKCYQCIQSGMRLKHIT